MFCSPHRDLYSMYITKRERDLWEYLISDNWSVCIFPSLRYESVDRQFIRKDMQQTQLVYQSSAMSVILEWWVMWTLISRMIEKTIPTLSNAVCSDWEKLWLYISCDGINVRYCAFVLLVQPPYYNKTPLPMCIFVLPTVASHPNISQQISVK